MKTKRKYEKPTVTKIKLDNEITMVMMSEPPVWESLPTNPYKWIK